MNAFLAQALREAHVRDAAIAEAPPTVLDDTPELMLFTGDDA